MTRPRRVLAVALGETDELAGQFAAERFPGARVEWLDRRDLRQRPVWTIWRLLSRRYDDALAFLQDLDAPRARLTALLAGLPRARRRWVADARGQVRPFVVREHLAAAGPPTTRHLLAMGLALVLARPALRLADAWLAREERLGLRRPRSSRPDRLLYLRPQFWFGLGGGGSVGHTAGVIGGLQSTGVDVRVLSTDSLPGVEAPLAIIRPEQWFDGRWREVEQVAFNPRFCFEGLRLARAFRPRVLYQRYTAFNLSGALLSRVLRVPLVLEFNSSDVWKGRHWGEVRRLDLADMAERVSLRAADLVVVVSRVLRDDLVRAGVPASKILVNPNAVDVERFRPGDSGFGIRDSTNGNWESGFGIQETGFGGRESGVRKTDGQAAPRVPITESRSWPPVPVPQRPTPESSITAQTSHPPSRSSQPLNPDSRLPTPVVGFSGTFGVWHGIPTLAAALPLIAEARPQVRFLIIGDGPLRGLVDEAVDRHGLGDRVAMTGLLPYEHMPQYLAACDVLLSPHGRQVDGGEFFGSPTKLYEYMATGRAIVASAVGQIAEVLEDGVTALLVPPDDPRALADAVVRLIDDPDLRARLGAAARAKAEREHTWRGNEERVLRALELGRGEGAELAEEAAPSAEGGPLTPTLSPGERERDARSTRASASEAIL